MTKKKTLPMAVKKDESKAEIQLFLNSFNFYFYMAKNIKMQRSNAITQSIIFSYVILKAHLAFAMDPYSKL